MKRLDGKVAVITGAAGAIGAASVRRFVAEGAKVVIADFHGIAAVALAQEIGPDTLPVTTDIGNEESVKATMEQAVSHFGSLDILFNNAALTDPNTQTADTNAVDTSNDVWERTLHVNLTGYLYCCRHAILHMARDRGGVIINMASGAGLLGDSVRLAYGTSKAGVIAMTKYLATQHGRQYVRANAIAPGPIATALARQMAGAELDILTRHMPMGELGTPEDVAALAAFLAADESRYINGQIINIDGGMSAHHPHVVDMQDHAAHLASPSG